MAACMRNSTSVCVRKRVRLTRAESTSVEYRERYKVARAAGRREKSRLPAISNI